MSVGVVIRHAAWPVGKFTQFGLVRMLADGRSYACPCCGDRHRALRNEDCCKRFVGTMPDEVAERWAATRPAHVAKVGEWRD